MKIAIAADTHGRIESLKKQLLKEKPDYLFFAGDFLSDARRLAHYLKIDTYAVLGNCDRSTTGEWEQTVELAGRRFYVIHGHQYGVKGNLNSLFYRGQELDVDVVVFGHTHVPLCEEEGSMWMLNPGSGSRPRKGKQASYIIIHAEESHFIPEIKYFLP